MTNICIELKQIASVMPDETRKGNIRPGYEDVNVHMIFDIKTEGRFTRK